VRSSALSRRSFLAAAGGLVVASACGSDRSGEAVGAGDRLAAGLLSSDLYATSTPQRFAFALTDRDGYASGPPARIAFVAPDGALGPFTAAGLHADGLPPERGVYVLEAMLPQPGTWQATVDADGRRAPLAFTVRPEPAAPGLGDPAPRVPSPTVADPMGVDPLCTRDPDCHLHEGSLATLIGAGTPAAVMFATPARCESRYCGPVLEEMLTLVDAYRSRVAFAHVEIYQAETGTQLVSTVEAWGLPGEPWLFGVDTGGTVVARLDGAFGRGEIRALLDALTG
jgi:hypothetical protein